MILVLSCLNVIYVNIIKCLSHCALISQEYTFKLNLLYTTIKSIAILLPHFKNSAEATEEPLIIVLHKVNSNRTSTLIPFYFATLLRGT